ncbi:MAG TPA: hypothetical protein PJ982_17610, partial [Lacipirellulaceae bacterium]|nr:hypothetical protein [Lacipirellulaceae bacterium]
MASAWADSVEAAPRWDGRLTVRVVDEESGAPLAARMELRDGRGRILRIAPQNVVVMPDGLYLDGQVELELRRGEYRFTVEAGPEFETRDGEFTIEPRSEDVAEVPLRRRVDMAHEGWWAGDLDVHVAGNDALLAARARGVAFAPATAWVQREAKCQTLFSDNMVDHHGTAPPWVGPQAALLAGDVGDLLLVGGASLRDGCPWPTGDAGATRLAEARATGTCVVARTATAWMLPVWIARGEIDAVSLFPAATAALEDPAQRPPNDPRLYPGREGPGRFCEAIYTHLLNCGLRIPPAAGSGADRQTSRRGASAIPLGASRVYVHLNESPTPKMWLAGLREGRVVATNGPLLRTRVEGRPPGHVFSLRAGEQREFQIALDLAFY